MRTDLYMKLHSEFTDLYMKLHSEFTDLYMKLHSELGRLRTEQAEKYAWSRRESNLRLTPSTPPTAPRGQVGSKG